MLNITLKISHSKPRELSCRWRSSVAFKVQTTVAIKYSEVTHVTLYSYGGDQHGSADCEGDGAPPLILYEDNTNTVRYTYRITWNVRSITSLTTLI
jgi:hypothetical protein